MANKNSKLNYDQRNKALYYFETCQWPIKKIATKFNVSYGSICYLLSQELEKKFESNKNKS